MEQAKEKKNWDDLIPPLGSQEKQQAPPPENSQQTSPDKQHPIHKMLGETNNDSKESINSNIPQFDLANKVLSQHRKKISALRKGPGSKTTADIPEESAATAPQPIEEKPAAAVEIEKPEEIIIEPEQQVSQPAEEPEITPEEIAVEREKEVIEEPTASEEVHPQQAEAEAPPVRHTAFTKPTGPLQEIIAEIVARDIRNLCSKAS